MIRVPGKAALALLQAISAAFVVSSRDGHAQDRPGGRAQSMAVLGAAIAEAQRSPFHRVGPAGSVITPVAIMPPPRGKRRAMLQEKGQDPTTDETSTSKVFFVTAAATHLSDIVCLSLVVAGIYSEDLRTANLLALSGVGVAVFGPALAAAWTVGRDFVAALAGSVLGAVLAGAVGVAVAESDMPFFVAFPLAAFLHAGIVTLTVAGW